MNALRRREIFRILAAERPDPESELHFSTPFELLVAVMLSAQATDKSVNAATEKLFPVASTPQDFVRLGEAGLIPTSVRSDFIKRKPSTSSKPADS